MKRPKQNFLVEYKSSRRQAKPRANSIWGDADLKALARELEQQSHSVFIVDRPLDMATGGGDIEPENTAVANDRDSGNCTSLPVPPIAVLAFEAQQNPELDVVPIASRSAAVVHKPQSVEKPSAAKASQQSARPSESGAAEADELVALEAENRRLKLLLAEKLRKENTQLKRMLERREPVRKDQANR
ncbi:hypothetical protein [Sinorhizobium meliloti]|uniref:hypothetical protein n=1 Tax=Rhizobium meliloti TaxID=382 RepID=UPI003F165126